MWAMYKGLIATGILSIGAVYWAIDQILGLSTSMTVAGQTFTGKVESLSPATGARFSMLPPDNASGNFVKVVQRVPVKIAWTNLPKNVIIEAGLSVDVTIHVE